MGAGGPFGSLQMPFMGNPRLQTAGAALGMAPPEQIVTSPINGLLSLRGKLGGSATTPQVKAWGKSAGSKVVVSQCRNLTTLREMNSQYVHD